MALALSGLLYGSSSGQTFYHGSCVSAMIDDKLFGNYDDLNWFEYRRLWNLHTSIYESIHRAELLTGRHVNEAKMVLDVSEPCDKSHERDDLVCDIYSVFDAGARSLQIYTDENGIVIKTKIVPT